MAKAPLNGTEECSMQKSSKNFPRDKKSHVTIEKLDLIKIKKFRDTSLELPESGIVAIMGANGSGKSTILHVLACLYQPNKSIHFTQETYKWSRFFIPHEGNFWRGSKVSADFLGQKESIDYQKTSERWTPKYSKRPERFVRFIGVGDFYPHIEREKYHTKFQLSRSDLASSKKEKILEYARAILRKDYQDINKAQKRSGTLRELLQVEVNAEEKLKYTSFYMGGGEQKIFYLLEVLLDAPKDSLILIEELETLLHASALSRLIESMIKIAKEKNFQIVFSTHWTGIQKFQEKIAIKTLVETSTGVAIINGVDPNVIYDLTSETDEKSMIDVWVEDELSEQIIKSISAELALHPRIKISRFGSGTNAFSIAAYYTLSNKNNCVVVLDGDIFVGLEEKQDQLKKTISGTESEIKKSQERSVDMIVQFNPGTKSNPEDFLLSLLDEEVAAPTAEIQSFRARKKAIYKKNGKEIILDFQQYFRFTPEALSFHLIEHARKCCEQWSTYTAEVRKKLEEKAKPS
jgi:ABC-type lipoprotein export system ATPase subunit